MSQLTPPTAGLAVFPPSRWRCSFARIPPRPNSRCLLKPAPARPSHSSGRRRRDWWCRGAIVSLRICRRSARILPRAAGRYGFAAPAAVWCPRGRALSTLASPGRCSSRSAKPPNRSIIRCALCCSAPARFGVASPPGGERFLLRWPV